MNTKRADNNKGDCRFPGSIFRMYVFLCFCSLLLFVLEAEVVIVAASKEVVLQLFCAFESACLSQESFGLNGDAFKHHAVVFGRKDTLSFLPTSRHFTIIPQTTSLELKRPQPLNLFFFSFFDLCVSKVQGLIQSIEGPALVPQVVQPIIRTPSRRASLAFQQPRTLKKYYSRYSRRLFQSRGTLRQRCLKVTLRRSVSAVCLRCDLP